MSQGPISHFFKKYIKLPVLVFKASIVSAIKKDGVEHAGYLAFLSILSLFPFLIFVVSISSAIGDSHIGQGLITWFLTSIPADIAAALEPRLMEISSATPQSLLTIAVIGIIWTASSMVEGARTILNRAYRVESPPAYIWRRLLSILQFFIIACGIIIMMFVLVVVPAVLHKIEPALFAKISSDWHNIRYIIIFLVLLSGTCLLYYFIPNVEQSISATLPGALIALFLWTFTLNLFSLYLRKFNQFNLVYGSLAGIIGFLMFFYFISLVFIIGAEFNYLFHRAYRGVSFGEPRHHLTSQRRSRFWKS